MNLRYLTARNPMGAHVAEKAFAFSSVYSVARMAAKNPSTKLPRIRRLRRSELPLNTEALARFLIGKTLVHDLPRGRLRGRIVETEAYVTGDAAAHSFRGQTPRNRSLFLERGHAYVYFTYGNHFMLNVSGGREGIGEGVLLRAVEPLEGTEQMMHRRGTRNLHDLARGPGRLAEAFRIDKRLDGADLCAPGPLWLGTGVRRTGPIGTSVRIGITKEIHRPLRFYECGSPFVSGLKRLRS
ncbi:MAG TPA: DNA-3-methyladenine glycosylase [Candidatus Limnocylindrales bacterium]|nr:DNA-3-methyladenine glycosylase [Candidatus Limnocylindrales bacterium]